MGTRSGISWTHSTWNPVTGCDKVSPGCDHCYALGQAARLKAMGSAHYQADGDPATSGPGFAATEHPDALTKPLVWRHPRMIFVNSMSDLFHPDITDEFIVQVWATMLLAHQHTFQVLTKRHGRLRSLLTKAGQPGEPGFESMVRREARNMAADLGMDPTTASTTPWPLPNVWLGVSVEDQKRAELRLDALADTPAALRFVSCEPLLGPVDLASWLPHVPPALSMMGGVMGILSQGGRCDFQPGDLPSVTKHVTALCRQCVNGRRISWVIVGGESGKDSRRMDPDWAASIQEQCAASGVAYFFKQTGTVLAGEWGIPKKGDTPAHWPEPFPQQSPAVDIDGSIIITG